MNERSLNGMDRSQAGIDQRERVVPDARRRGRPDNTVLVVDDDPAIRSLLAAVLSDEGFGVRFAFDGIDALSALDTGLIPVLVILDLAMPVMDGREFYRALRARRCTAPVLIVSAHGARAARAELGAQAALAKPFDIEVLGRLARELATTGSARSR